jgi:hypothetical protein
MIVYIQTDTIGELKPINSDEVFEMFDWGDGVCSIRIVGNVNMLVTDLEGDMIEFGWKLAGREIDYE